MGTKKNPSRYDGIVKALPDEPYFTLLARDPLARGLVFLWAALKEKQGVPATEAFAELARTAAIMEPEDAEKIADARRIAKDMLQWTVDNPGAAARGVDKSPAREGREPPA